MKNSLTPQHSHLSKCRLRTGVSWPARLCCSGALSAPLRSGSTTPEAGGLNLIAATGILTQLLAPISVAVSLYNPHSKR